MQRAGALASSLAGCGDKFRGADFSCKEHDQDAQTLVEQASELASLISHHVLPLGALGTRRSSLEHVMHSVVFRLRLECMDWADVEKFVLSTFSVTADQGTEGKVGDVNSIDLERNFPWWPVRPTPHEDPLLQDLAETAEGDREDEDSVLAVAAPDAPAGADCCAHSSTMHGFVRSARIPPHFHIIDKVSKSLLSALTLSWPRVEPGFKAVVVFFHARHTRRHFLQLCVPPSLQFLFSAGGPPAWDGGRAWGVLEKIVRWFLKREGAIKRNFDLQKLLHDPAKPRMPQVPQCDEPGRDDDGDEPTKRGFFEDRDGKNMKLCGAAIADPFFWGAMHLLGHFSEILEHMQSWMMGCACHPERAEFHS